MEVLRKRDYMTDREFNKKLRTIEKQGERYKQEALLREEYAPYWPDKKSIRVSKIMLGIIVFCIVSYVIAAFVLQYKTGIEMSPTITTCWFSFWGVELVALTGIKISKVFRPKNEE